jgi:glucose-6-phosphate isomerase
MRGMYADEGAEGRAIMEGDATVYEYYDLGPPGNCGDLAFGTSITYPGKVGDEFFMTKGHYHALPDTAEMYYALSGEGCMLTESPEGDTALHILTPGTAVYVPRRWAHRSVNTGAAPFVSFYTLRADAGHDYGAIESRGFRKLVVDVGGGKPQLADNPKWRA